MGKRLKVSIVFLILAVICFSTVEFSNADKVVKHITILLPSSPYINGELTKDDVKYGYKELYPVELLIESSVDWNVLAKVKFNDYPSTEPPVDIIEYYDPIKDMWSPVNGNIVLTGTSNIPSGDQYYSLKLRYNLLIWEGFCSGSYSFDLEFELTELAP